MRKIDEIIVHCSDTKPSWMQDKSVFQKAKEIKRWHVNKNGWSDIGYHLIIDRDGSFCSGRPLEIQGAHVFGHNNDTIGICLIGGNGSHPDDPPHLHFEASQLKALVDKIQTYHEQFGRLQISGHNDYANKACPGFRVHKFLRDNFIAPEFICREVFK